MNALSVLRSGCLYRRKLLLSFSTVGIPFFAAGCATRKSGEAQKQWGNRVWNGRISLRTDSTPPQQWIAAFELAGSAQAGELTLTNPLGQVAARATWSAAGAVLERAGEPALRYANLDELTAALTGQPWPVAAVFQWLDGQDDGRSGWQVDLSRLEDGRIQASQNRNGQTTDIRILLDRSS